MNGKRDKNIFIDEFRKFQLKILNIIINAIALLGIPVVVMELIQGRGYQIICFMLLSSIYLAI